MKLILLNCTLKNGYDSKLYVLSILPQFFKLKNLVNVLAGWLRWLECHPVHQKVVGLTPVRAHVGGNQWMFLSHADVLLSPAPFPCL